MNDTVTMPSLQGQLAMFAAAIALAVSVCPTGLQAQHLDKTPLWLVPPPGERAEIEATSTLQELAARFGSQNLTRGNIPTGENEMPGSILFPRDPTRRVEIVWNDRRRSAGLARVQIRGAKSRWSVAPGITLGTSLRDIEALNGRSFDLTGFDTDYSGTAVTWRGGHLEHLRTGHPRVIVRMQPSNRTAASMAEDHSRVVGDGIFSSTFGPMQRLNPKVYEVVVSYLK